MHIPIELRRRIPNLPIICDPSHIGGKRELIAPLCQQAMDLKEIDKINSALKVSVDEEYAIRAHQNYNPHKDGKQRLRANLRKPMQQPGKNWKARSFRSSIKRATS